MFAMMREAPKLSLRTQGDLQIMWVVRFKGFTHVFSEQGSQVAQWSRIVCQFRKYKRHEFDPWVGKIPWNRKWQSTPIFLPGKIPWTEDPGGWGCGGAGTVHRVTKTCTWLSMHTFTICIYHAFTICIYHLERSTEEMSLLPKSTSQELLGAINPVVLKSTRLFKTGRESGRCLGMGILTSTPDNSNRPDLGTTGL